MSVTKKGYPRMVLMGVLAPSLHGGLANTSEFPDESTLGEAYRQNCAACHGKAGDGAYAAPLRGVAFRTKWGGKDEALDAYIVGNMPPKDPGSLSPQIYARIQSYISLINGFSITRGTTPKLPAIAPNPGDRSSSFSEGISAGLPSNVPTNNDSIYQATANSRKVLLASMKPVTEDMLRAPPAADWLNWRRTDDGFASSPLQQINRQNAAAIKFAWSLALPVGTNQITPLVHDGVMFLNSSGTVLAINAATGDTLWKFSRLAHVVPIGPPVTQPRSVAIYGSTLYVPTIDNHMLALDAASGKLNWDHEIENSGGVLRLAGGPIVVHGKLIQGVSGCAGVGKPSGCYIVALDATTGREVWRFNTIARADTREGNTWNGAPMENRFGGSVWSSGTYDPEYNIVYFGTGQTYHIAPLMAHNSESTGNSDALYTDTTLALNPDTGKLIWFYQHMARDVWDLDWAFERTIVTLQTPSGPQKTVVTIGKLGILDALDAKTGAYRFSYDLGLQNLVTSIDPKTGRKTTDPSKEPEPNRARFICPFALGFRNWPATSYDGGNTVLYIPISDSCMEYSWVPSDDWDIHYALKPRPGGDGRYGEVAAINLNTRKLTWLAQRRSPESSSVLATGGGLLFEGSRDRLFRGSDSSSGRVLWEVRLDNVPNSSPITFMSGNEQYVSVTTGGGGPNDVGLQPLTPEFESTAAATTLWVFKASSTNP